MEALPRRLEAYKTKEGKEPFWDWYYSQDNVVKALVLVRFKRVEKGLFGDHKAEGKGVWALRFDDGQGTRIYYGLTDNQKVVLLLSGGEKKRQGRDIQEAIAFWEDYKKNEKHKDQK
jgi:putative addiction module killer protein